MADETVQDTGQGGEAAEERTFTQAQVDEIVAKRVARVKASVPEDYDDLKKAADKADKLQKELDGLRAAAKREQQVADAAKKHEVDAELLARMEGDVEENAEFLAKKLDALTRRYPVTRDAGEAPSGARPDAARQTAALLFGKRNS